METLQAQESQLPSEPDPRRGTYGEGLEIERIRWRVREKTDQGFAQSEVARKSGLSRATLNQFINGKYAGRNWDVAMTLDAWLQAVDKDQRAHVSVPTMLVDTPTGMVKVASVEPNSIVGEIAILCDIARTATVRASTPLQVLRIQKEQFLKLLVEFPEITLEIMRVLADRLGATTAELSEARNQLKLAGK